MKNHVWVEGDNIGNVNGFVLHTCAHTCASSASTRMQMDLSSGMCGVHVRLLIDACSCLCLSRAYSLCFSSTRDKVETGSDFNHIFLLPSYNPNVN